MHRHGHDQLDPGGLHRPFRLGHVRGHGLRQQLHAGEFQTAHHAARGAVVGIHRRHAVQRGIPARAHPAAGQRLPAVLAQPVIETACLASAAHAPRPAGIQKVEQRVAEAGEPGKTRRFGKKLRTL